MREIHMDRAFENEFKTELYAVHSKTNIKI